MGVPPDGFKPSFPRGLRATPGVNVTIPSSELLAPSSFTLEDYGTSRDNPALLALVEYLREIDDEGHGEPLGHLGLISRRVVPSRKQGNDARASELWAVRTVEAVQVEIPTDAVIDVIQLPNGRTCLIVVLGDRNRGVKLHIHGGASVEPGQVVTLNVTVVLRRYFLCDEHGKPIMLRQSGKKPAKGTVVNYIWELNAQVVDTEPEARLVVRDTADEWYSRHMTDEGICLGGPDRSGQAIEYAYRSVDGSDDQHFGFVPMPLAAEFTCYNLGLPAVGEDEKYEAELGHASLATHRPTGLGTMADLMPRGLVVGEA